MRVFSFLELIFWLLASILVFLSAKIDCLSDKDVETKAYIVYMGERKHSDVELLTKSHHDMLSSVLGSKEAAMDSMIYSYRHGFSGFAAKMTKSQAQYIAELPDVIEVFANRFYKLHTTRSWDFLGLSQYSTSNLLHDSNQGDGAIIGVVDSGIWPESESFKDNGMGPIPTKWKGFCQSGDEFDPVKHCNKKIIGARYFIEGFLAEINEPFNATENQDYLSPRDFYGHGTHCASTAGGSFVSNVSTNGLAYGTARGGAPRARLAIYKVGWVDGTYITSADTLKAFDEAIHDGVDVLSLSLGIDLPLYQEIDKHDLIYYGSFHAVAHSITVVCSGGNSGPLYQTVEDVAPWITTVAASTMDRSFPIGFMLGNNRHFVGEGMYGGEDTGFLDLLYREPTLLGQTVDCEQITGNDTWVVGKVVLCFTTKATGADIINAASTVEQIGGLGIIATRKTVSSSATYYAPFPVVLVTYDVGTEILKDPKVRFKPSKTYVGKDVSTYIASFSSRGPNSLSPAILKPDIAAPGVDVLAAYPPKGLNSNGYAFDSGTSMAAPHIAGITALLKSLHPNWSPAAIKSALITTAWTADPYSGEPIFARGDIPKIADPFDYGGGLVNPNAAKHPGLVYDMGTQDYINYLCAMGYNQTLINQLTGWTISCPKSGNSVLDLNLPSITVPNLKGSITITRTVTNVGEPNSKYEVVVHPPLGTVVKVNPTHLFFNRNITRMSFTVTITTLHKITTEYYFGSLTWTDKMHNVRIPISVRTEFPQVYGS
ncbi:Tripeptidyl-peptidase II [Handroanthus impetiginosus]|uniref:Tripeptidyl-peptidase II n=1 Tax=Handroanthus impetiginosus TaxID=429701 RepID=A0A2G9HZG6_9LAMI|nr:Tripeptidyl-peptidase II [Handroanthus impetiginosus]